MVVIEKTKHYVTQDLMDRINSSLLQDPAKKLLKWYVSEISLQTAELYHQFSRQCLSVNCYRLLWELNKFFAKVVFDFISSETVSIDSVKTKVQQFDNQAYSVIKSAEGQISISLFEHLECIYDKICEISDKFVAQCQGIVINNQNIYYDGVTDLDDYLTPKHYKLKINDEPEQKVKEKPEKKVQHLDLDQLGLKVRRY